LKILKHQSCCEAEEGCRGNCAYYKKKVINWLGP
jgi:hypothetical protein